MGEPTRRRCSECSLFSSRSMRRSPRTTWPTPSRSHSRMRNARDSQKLSRPPREPGSGRGRRVGVHGAAGVAVGRVGRPAKCAGKGTREHVGPPSLNPHAKWSTVIAAVRGTVIARGVDHVVVESNGVGYKVHVPRQPSRDEVLLHTHHIVREDDQSLYGFESRDELALFEMLITVSGVGPKAAMALLMTSRPADIAAAIASGDAAALARAPGVGKKTAERLIVDLRGRIGRGGGADGAAGPAPLDDDSQAALVALGYTPAEAATALHGVPAKGRASTEERLAAALRATGRTAVAGR